MKKTVFFRPSSSFALISVLALVSLAALSATAFLASARLQRLATRSLYNSTRLEMALNAGAMAAQEMLDYAPSKHFNFVTTYWRGTAPQSWTNELGYLLNGAVFSSSIKTSTVVNFYCCFSTATFTNLSNSSTALVMVSNAASQQGNFTNEIAAFMQNMTNFASGQSTNIPLLGDSPNNRYTSPPVGWVYINQDVRTKIGTTNTTNIPVVRFAFYVQDLGGLIDAERMGGATRDTGTNPAEISLTNASGTSLSKPAIATPFSSTNNRPRYLTPGLILRAGNLTTNDLRYVASGLRAWSNNYFRIPMGLGYAQSESLKTNLNANSITLSNITSAIGSNLPSFYLRAGGFSNASTNYNLALAASIIDYADKDSEPTITNGVRGIEALPFVNERVTMFNLIKTNSATVAGIQGTTVTILSQDFYEFWNLSTKTTTNNLAIQVIASNNLGVVFTNTNNVRITNFFNNPTAATNAAGIKVLNGITTNIFTNNLDNLGPNQFKVVSGLAVTNEFFVPLTNMVLPGITVAFTNFFRYQVSYANKMYDQSLVGCWIDTTNNLVLNTPKYIGSYSAFGAQNPQNTFRNTMGDPRMAFYLNDNQDQVTYAAGSSFGGRNFRTGKANMCYEQVLPSRWPDGGYDSAAGNAAGNNLPTAVTPALYTNLPPGRISDSGLYSNICALGNIYDPIQWADKSVVTPTGWGSETNGGQWSLLTTNGFPFTVGDNKYGGGNTLRIGRWEHPRFAFTNLPSANKPTPNMQLSAAALLDIFCVTNVFDEGGKINLNTAPAPVLRALAGGVILTNDPNIPTAVNTLPAAMAEAFAQGVMRFRATYPFYSPSQLAFISTDYGTNYVSSPPGPWINRWPTNSVFGNLGTIALQQAPGNNFVSATIGFSQCSDPGAEDWFSKVYGLATVQSRNYRCYVMAQLVDSNKNGIGPVVRKYYQIYSRENNNASTDTAPSASTYNMFESPY